MLIKVYIYFFLYLIYYLYYYLLVIYVNQNVLLFLRLSPVKKIKTVMENIYNTFWYFHSCDVEWKMFERSLQRRLNDHLLTNIKSALLLDEVNKVEAEDMMLISLMQYFYFNR